MTTAAVDMTATLERAAEVFARRPAAALHDDGPALARWTRDLRVATSAPNGAEFLSDMPRELGGEGEAVTPGWFLRAGLAACTATSIAMTAARAGVQLDLLEVRATSRSDARGVLGVADADGREVYAGPRALTLAVRVAARGVAPARLRALVETGCRRSPIGAAVVAANDLELDIAVEGAA
jgi:uncharacterized OsmC-like protein